MHGSAPSKPTSSGSRPRSSRAPPSSRASARSSSRISSSTPSTPSPASSRRTRARRAGSSPASATSCATRSTTQTSSEILESRHAGTLSFVWEIEPSARRALLPRLLLQPLVENAVKHGALRRRGGGVVTVRAALDDTRRVICTVEDNGPGLPDVEPRQGAFGLHSVRRRLELKFPDAVLRMESSRSGTRSIVELPGLPIANKELS